MTSRTTDAPERSVGDVLVTVERLIVSHDVFPERADTLVDALHRVGAEAAGLSASQLAQATTEALQEACGDLHLRLVYHREPMVRLDDEARQWQEMAAWAGATDGGVPQAGLHDGVGIIALRPVLFPLVFSADRITAAFDRVADARAVVLDLRDCLGGDPATAAFVASYVTGPEPVHLTDVVERGDRVRQWWTQTVVPGTRLASGTPLFVATSARTFSGGEQLAYDLQQLGRATIVGETTRGGAHPRESFRVTDHLELTLPVAFSRNAVSGTDWEGVGVVPDVAVAGGLAVETACTLAAVGRRTS